MENKLENNIVQKILLASDLDKNFVIDIKEDSKIVLRDISNEGDYVFNVLPNVNFRLSILGIKEVNKAKITVNLGRNSVFNGYFADFIPHKSNINIMINLNEEDARAYWRLASLASNDDHKEFVVNINHNAKNTYAKMDNYGVCKDESRLVFSGDSVINKYCTHTETHQNAKIMVFDPTSKAVAKPILKIDENDVIASHAAIVGRINENHLYYLTSRGLTIPEAKQLITFGYLKPILVGFDDQEIAQEIEELIEKRM